MTQKSAAKMANEMIDALEGQDSEKAEMAISRVIAWFVKALETDTPDIEVVCMTIAIQASVLARLKPSTLQ